MAYTYRRSQSPSFTGTGLEGYSFGPLRQKDFDVYYIESEKGHDTFMVSKRICRTYYVVAGTGYFTIDNRRYEVSPGMLVEVPPKVEYSFSGKMTLLGFARPRWFRKNDKHTRWNPDVTCRVSDSLPGREPWLTKLLRVKIFGRTPAGVFLGLNRRLWPHLPRGLDHSGLLRSYGALVHSFARRHSVREQAFSTNFLRNRPELELMRWLVEPKPSGVTLKAAVLGCSMGAQVYSIAWMIKSVRPDLNLILNAVDISPQAVAFAGRGVYPLNGSGPTGPTIFDRMTEPEQEDFFDKDCKAAAVKTWFKEGIRWYVGDAGEPEIVDTLGAHDMVVANNFLCHMQPSEAERCLRNIVRLVSPYGYLFVSGIDLDVRTKVARDLGWKPVENLVEEIHEGDPVMRMHWPWHYGGLEPLDKRRPDWKIRYAAAFQVMPRAIVRLAPTEYDLALPNSNR